MFCRSIINKASAKYGGGITYFLHCKSLRTSSQVSMSSKVSKSYYEEDPVKNYCIAHSSPLHPVQQKLIEETLKHTRSAMMGAPEVTNLNAVLIRSLGAKKVLDIGVFTGASSLAAALALPDDGIVVGCDVSEDFTARARKYWQEAGVENKVHLKIAPATETLQKLVDNNEAGTFDFAFIDADKQNYDSYYELSLTLLRKGGIIAIDNVLWRGLVITNEDQSADTEALRKLNKKLSEDTRVKVVMINIGDGCTL